VKHEDYAAWLVDFDGTLYRPKPVQLAMAAELLLTGLPRVPVIRAFRAEHERLRSEEALHEPSPFHAQLARAAERTQLAPEVIERIVREWMQERPCKWIRRFVRTELVTELRSFRAAGGKLAVVSDYPVRAKLAALELTELFDVVVANGEADGPASLKPTPAGFLRAAERLSVAPAACLVIGDRDDADGEASRRAGMGFRLVR